MSCVWNNSLKLSIFGESHGAAIGVVMDGLPPGIELDLDKIMEEMDRRRPGKDPFSTSRNEADAFEILSGFFEGKTTGTALTAIIKNNSQKSKDYSKTKDLMRPSHGDYPGYIKYDGFNDYRGGGHFSGRITAPFVFAGAVAKQVISRLNIEVVSYISSIGEVKSEFIDSIKLDKELIGETDKNFPTLSNEIKEQFQKEIIDAKQDGDSIGGSIRCLCFGLKAGIGSPFFDSLESRIASLAFSVPAVKGIEFGKGFDISMARGSVSNDSMYIESGEVKLKTNNNGGIFGGISNGAPIDFTVAIKPTPSIYKEQDTFNIKTMTNEIIKIEGRHDPCIVQRAVPVIESVMAISVLDGLLSTQELGKWWV